ncbi:S1/P1 nuclease [Tahibacter aquaticus]|uniref:S1/P1 nuclease n=1 Tax=Tahibacter aquaticus TaxID=520092 RepID=A0A4V3DLN4_9GAMM|nr:S1/P1 nuclease [Tahibacter aquaticus]TDR40416.1 S1/P1 nuclease [Tahibacter aquaticus]
MCLQRSAVILFAVAALAASAPLLAWGPIGHRTVAGLAQEHLSPAVQKQVRQLLEPDNESTLVDVATWADDLRDTDPARYRSTGKMHYVNFASGQCSYVPQRDCRKGECVVAAIERYEKILGDRSRPRAERADALRFVVHFIADVHQPLHASFKRDKGGNTVQLRYGRENWNLHGVWDSLLLKSAGLRWPDYVRRLAPGVKPADRTGPAQWAEESCRVVRDEGVYPEGNSIDEAYLARELPVAERRMQLAAARLDAVLERVLGGSRD